MSKLLPNTPFFSEEEYSCKCGACTAPPVDPNFLYKLTKLRRLVDRPFPISSWYRCPAYNKLIGGSLNSYHTKGIAVDISTVNWSKEDIGWLVAFAPTVGLQGLIIYNGWVHVDDRPTRYFSVEFD